MKTATLPHALWKGKTRCLDFWFLPQFPLHSSRWVTDPTTQHSALCGRRQASTFGTGPYQADQTACCHWLWEKLPETASCGFWKALFIALVCPPKETQSENSGLSSVCGPHSPLCNGLLGRAGCTFPPCGLCLWKESWALLERRHYWSPCEKAGVILSNGGCEKVGGKSLETIPLIIHLCGLTYLSTNLSTIDKNLKTIICLCHEKKCLLPQAMRSPTEKKVIHATVWASASPPQLLNGGMET